MSFEAVLVVVDRYYDAFCGQVKIDACSSGLVLEVGSLEK